MQRTNRNMKNAGFFALLALAACGAPELGEELELGTTEQESYAGEQFGNYTAGADIGAGNYGKKLSQCATTHSTQLCVVPSEGVFLYDTEIDRGISQQFIWVKGPNNITSDSTFLNATPELRGFLSDWIQNTDAQAQNVWKDVFFNDNIQQFIRTERLETPGGVVNSYQGRIGGTWLPNVPYDRTLAASYMRVDGLGCEEMWSQPAQPGMHFQCDVIRVYIDESRIAASATYYAGQGLGTAASIRQKMTWQIAGQAFFITQGLGTTGTTSLVDPMRRQVIPLADPDELGPVEWFMNFYQQCMTVRRQFSTASLGLGFTDYSSADCATWAQ